MDSFSTADVERGRIHTLPGQPRLPLSVIPDALNVTGSSEGTWKRISRACVGTNVVMEEALRTKRTTRHTAGQSELQKKKRKFLSQIGNEINMILAKAGSQPCQKP